jgi:hypothetical protein
MLPLHNDWSCQRECVLRSLVAPATTFDRRHNSRITAPREDQFLHASCANQLVIDQVRREADSGQIFLALPDDLLTGSEWNEMSETFEGDRVAVMNMLGNRRLKSHEFAHQYSNTAVETSGLFYIHHYSK